MDTNSTQEIEWQLLHDRITELLDRHGRKNGFREGDYWLLDDNWGRYRQEVEIQNLNLLKPHIIESLKALLASYPNWYITIRVDVPGKEHIWPGMGVAVYPDEIVDELLREFLPKEFRSIRYG